MPRTSPISSRRYLGNKYKLLPFIRRVVAEQCRDVESVADVFSGTGAVAYAFREKALITNDILYSNYLCNLAWFGSQPYDPKKVAARIDEYNAHQAHAENYMTRNFHNTYFSRVDCSKIGYIRGDIERAYRAGALNEREHALLVTSLLYAMDRSAQTCGHYDAYRRGAVFDRPVELAMPDASVSNNPLNRCLNMDANELVRTIRADLVYIDPPYNSRQYSDAYHLLENVARWEKPPVHGVARKMDRSRLKSAYCTKDAPTAFADLVQHIHARYILFSYNNMAKKGDGRSNAKISDETIQAILSSRGEVRVFCESHRAFSAGLSDIQNHEERLFLCIIRH